MKNNKGNLQIEEDKCTQFGGFMLFYKYTICAVGGDIWQEIDRVADKRM